MDKPEMLRRITFRRKLEHIVEDIYQSQSDRDELIDDIMAALPPETHAGEKVGLQLPEKLRDNYDDTYLENFHRDKINDIIDYLSQKEDSHE